MAFEQTTAGLDIQLLAEIIGEYEVSHRTDFGLDVALGPESLFGREIAIDSEREALIQALVQSVQSQFSKNGAEGTNLDSIIELFGATRLSQSKSKSNAGRAFGMDGTFITNGSTVTQDSTSQVWTIVDGPDSGDTGYLIDAAAVRTLIFIEATDFGPEVFAAADTFTIGTPIAGWTSFDVTRDIEGFETGRLVESDPEVRQRTAVTIYAGGNDISGIKAVIRDVQGVTEVQGFENRSSVTVDGIPPFEMEFVVTGGLDGDIAEAIATRAPPGAQTFGTTGPIVIADGEGNDINFFHTRPALIPIYVKITLVISPAGVEGKLPGDYEQLVTDVVLATGNANSAVNQDVISQQFIGPVMIAVKDPFADKFPLDSVQVRVGLSAPPVSSDNIPISKRERADYDSLRITVELI